LHDKAKSRFTGRCQCQNSSSGRIISGTR